MKKILALILTLAMVFALCACGGNAKQPNEASDPPAAEKAGDPVQDGNEGSEPKPFKIGYFAYTSQTANLTPQTEGIERVCEALGGEAVSVVAAANTKADFLDALNTLISMGCDGVVLNFANLGLASMPAVAQACDEAGVYWSLFYTYPSFSEEIMDVWNNSEYYVGRAYNGEYQAGYDAMKALHEAGCSKTGYFGLPVSNDCLGTRDEGIKKACEDFDMEILAEQRDYTYTLSAEGGATTVENFLTTYPEMDSILVGSLGSFTIPGIMQSLEALGRDDIKVSVIEFSTDMDTYFDSGKMIFSTGHNVNGATYMAIAVANAIQGTPLSEDKILICDKMINIDNTEDHVFFKDYLYSPVYEVDELKNCLQLTNPDFTLASLEEMSEAYTFDWWKARH